MKPTFEFRTAAEADAAKTCLDHYGVARPLEAILRALQDATLAAIMADSVPGDPPAERDCLLAGMFAMLTFAAVLGNPAKNYRFSATEDELEHWRGVLFSLVGIERMRRAGTLADYQIGPRPFPAHPDPFAAAAPRQAIQ